MDFAYAQGLNHILDKHWRCPSLLLAIVVAAETTAASYGVSSMLTNWKRVQVNADHVAGIRPRTADATSPRFYFGAFPLA